MFGTWCSTCWASGGLRSSATATSSDSLTWLHGEGVGFKNGQVTTDVHIPVDPDSKEAYEGMMDRAVSAELVMELFGANGGPFAKKPVTFNGVDRGVYSSVGWQHAEGKIGCPMEVSLRLPLEAE